MKSLLNRLAPAQVWIKLPHSFDRKTMYGFLEDALHPNLEPKSYNVVLDFSRMKFVDPSAITVIANTIWFLRKRKVKVDFANHGLSTDSNRFLDDSGFFETFDGKSVFKDSTLRKTTLPLQQVAHDRSFAWINNIFSPWIAAKVGLSEASFASIKVCLQEIFNNILDHSGEKVGCVFAQHYPRQDQVMLSISDFGVGIPSNVRKVKPGLSDSEAIAQAVIEGFTTKSTVRNQGAGLDILTRYIVVKNQGSIHVHSLRGSFQCIHAASGARHLHKEVASSYPGTLVQITFNTNFLEPVAEKEEFEW